MSTTDGHLIHPHQNNQQILTLVAAVSGRFGADATIYLVLGRTPDIYGLRASQIADQCSSVRHLAQLGATVARPRSARRDLRALGSRPSWVNGAQTENSTYCAAGNRLYWILRLWLALWPPSPCCRMHCISSVERYLAPHEAVLEPITYPMLQLGRDRGVVLRVDGLNIVATAELYPKVDAAVVVEARELVGYRAVVVHDA